MPVGLVLLGASLLVAIGCGGRTGMTSGTTDGGHLVGDGNHPTLDGSPDDGMTLDGHPYISDDGGIVITTESFWMGCNEAVDPECYPDEYPYHRVTLTAFRIDRTEVTVAAYADCHGSGDCSAPDTTGMGGRCNWDKPERADHPINCVTWEQARAYCAWAGKRLPTEAEWEMAARGTDGRRYPWGNDVPMCARANYGRCVGDVTEPVGSHPTGTSACGASDMAGNVDEWVADWYDMDYYGSSPAVDPPGPSTGEFRVVRGGSWFNIPWYLRTSARTRNDPSTRYLGTGFRCAQSLE